MSDEQRTQDRIGLAILLARTPGLEQHWFYLSFVREDDDGKDYFAGGVYIRAPMMEAAVPRSHELGLNPGGEVSIVGPIPVEAMDAHCPAEMRETLLSREQIEAM